ncbi:site-specific DNA-methyltransferase [Treponema endosymbiont of Eucomonympha sp.]|uniref:site-specific DNA-methyltransferase n=1 Tax=Treponema endosymbiont of Eucomonympha sp. TaxID=1580831 RepID=UPI001930E710|nr:site-specific DNA-methyltransferase [Treponema endosymbiont of Eucomonympha sp.]
MKELGRSATAERTRLDYFGKAVYFILMPNKRPAPAASQRQIDAYTYEGEEEYRRKNIPPVGYAADDIAASPETTYAYDPHIDPSLQWAGKTEGTSFTVPASSIHIHESIKPHKIIRTVQAKDNSNPGGQTGFDFFETDAERNKRRTEAIEFYQHGVDLTNRLIAGDSLVIMNSLLEKEGMAGQVQMVYIDPPYGIRYGSNFQPFVDKRDVKDGKDEDLSQEPEMIKAFRDTWELGIHSYLTYLRNRLLLAKELLSESGSVFVQISDENVHHVREICDEVFGAENFVSLITFRKSSSATDAVLAAVSDYLIWYAKDKQNGKFHKLFENHDILEDSAYAYVENVKTHEIRRVTNEEKKTLNLNENILFTLTPTHSQTGSPSTRYPYEFEEKSFCPPRSGGWRTSRQGLDILAKSGRLMAPGGTALRFKHFFNDFPVRVISNLWQEKLAEQNKDYVVQTNIEVIKRCLLMTTDPGDLVLDITCGSGTTAYVAEQWGRRWITCDTSRIAITLAKKRLMTATFDYYKLARPEQGVGSGFVYKTVPHITLKSIANSETPEQEILYDQPEIDKKIVRVSGPFTVEALPAPVVKPLDDSVAYVADAGKKQSDWMTELLATGIIGRNGDKIEFSRVEVLSGTQLLHAEAETKENPPRRAAVCFAGETRPLDSRMAMMALEEANSMMPIPQIVVFAAFQFDPVAAKTIDEKILVGQWKNSVLLKVQMNTDLMTADLKKNRSSNQSFWLIGQPDIDLIKIDSGEDKGKYIVRVNGFDYYDVKKGTVDSGDTARIALWMLDTDYDGMCIDPVQVFFPISGKNDGWTKLAKTLHAEIDQDLIEKYTGNESVPFKVKDNTLIAVKIVDDRGIESLKVIPVGNADSGN